MRNRGYVAVEISYERSCEDHTAPGRRGRIYSWVKRHAEVITLVLTLLGLLIAAIGLFR